MSRTIRASIILLVLLLGFGFSQETMKKRAAEAEELMDEVMPVRKRSNRAPASVSEVVKPVPARTSVEASQGPETANSEGAYAPEDEITPPLARPANYQPTAATGIFRQALREFAKSPVTKESSKIEKTNKNSYLLSNAGFPRSPASAPVPTTVTSSGGSSSGSGSFSVTGFAIQNGELIVTGSNLSSITSIKVNGGLINATLVKTSSTSSRVAAMGLSAVELVVGTIYNLVISSAQAQATFPIEIDSEFENILIKGADPVLEFEDIDDANGSTARISANSDGNIYFDANANGSLTPGGHIFRADNGTKDLMVIENSGFVGIGIDPFRPLTVAGAIVSSNGLLTGVLQADGGLGGIAMGADSNHPVIFLTNNNEKMRLSAAGRLGIGTNNPGALLQVGEPLDATEARANAFTVMSDERLKKNFEVIPDALQKILSLNGYYYNWKGAVKTRKMGVKAQEIQKVFPEVVSKGSDGLLSVSYDHLAAPMIEAIKEQNREIAKLKSENEMLRSYLCHKDPAAPICK